MNSDAVPFSTLQEMSGKSEPAEVRSWLDQNKIKYFLHGKHNRPSTTVKALNAALGLESADNAAPRRSVTA